MGNIEKFFEICNRSLEDITDTEIGKFVELTGRYGLPSYWGDVSIDCIDRDMYGCMVVVEYSQTRVAEGVESVSRRTMFINVRSLTYFTSVEPCGEMEESCSICGNSELFMWLLGQGFNLFEGMTDGYVEPGFCAKRVRDGFVVARKTPEGVDVKDGEFARDAAEAGKLASERGAGYRVYSLVRVGRETEGGGYAD